jgi:hypothetical protein
MVRSVRTPINPIEVLLILFSTLSVLFVSALSLQLRPIADDYCLASATASHGFWGALNFWFTTVGGDYTGVLSNSLFVGTPVAFLPFEFASATTFLITLALLGIVVSLSFAVVARSKALFPPSGIFLGLLTPALWLVFWWSSSLRSMNEFNLSGPRSIVHWQNINSAYVMLVAVPLIWLLLLVRLKVQKRIALLINGAAIGIWVGGSGLVVSLLGVILALTLIALSFGSTRSVVSRNFLWLAVPWFLTNTLGWLLAYTSPGTQARRANLEEILGEKNIGAGDLLEFVFPKAIIEWVQILVSLGTILIFVIAFTVGSLIRPVMDKKVGQSGFKISGLLMVSSLLLNIISQSAAAFSYDAFWHTTSSATLIFFSIIVFGLSCGRAYQTYLPGHNPWPGAVILSATALVSVLVLNTAFVDAQQRLTAWNAGPAPLIGIADIDGEWVNACWSDLGEFRDTPKR